MPVRRAVHLSFRLSVRPTCERDILRTVSPIDLKFEILYQTTKNTDAIDFGPCAITKNTTVMLPIDHNVKLAHYPPQKD